MKNKTFNISILKLPEKEITYFLKKIKKNYIPSLDTVVNIGEYSKKISNNATQFISYNDKKLIGLLACYLNDSEGKTAYITILGVLEEYQGLGIASKLLDKLINEAREKKFEKIRLAVYYKNKKAIDLYKKKGYSVIRKEASKYIMECLIVLDNK